MTQTNGEPTTKKHKKKIRTKKAAILAAGYNFIMIVNKNYSKFNLIPEMP